MAVRLWGASMTGELVRVRKTCRCCGSAALELIVPLANVPIVSPNVDVTDKAVLTTMAPLDTYLCRDCGLIQLVHVVDPALIYRNYLYRTTISAGLASHFELLADAAVDRLGLDAKSFIVEFGSNDGTLLSSFHDRGMRVLGIDPAPALAAEASDRGVPTRADFFDEDLAAELLESSGPADLILSNNVMANIDDLGTVIRGIKRLLKPNGAYVWETQYALDVFEKTLLDSIYHEHISCFSVRPVVSAFERFDLEVFDAERIPTKGGSIRFWIQHRGGPSAIAKRVADLIALEDQIGLYDPAYHRRFSERIRTIEARLHELIAAARAANGRVAGYGASVGSAALIHQLRLEDKLDLVFDDSPFKERIEGPGYDLPVYMGDAVRSENPSLIVILAWRYAEAIMARQQDYLARGGTFVVPLPQVQVFGQVAEGAAT
jgi:SAM-dependent methyltransferase